MHFLFGTVEDSSVFRLKSASVTVVDIISIFMSSVRQREQRRSRF